MQSFSGYFSIIKFEILSYLNEKQEERLGIEHGVTVKLRTATLMSNVVHFNGALTCVTAMHMDY